MKANHESAWITIKTGKGDSEIFVESGQFIFGRKAAALELHTSQSSVRNRMAKLKNMGNLDIQPDSHYSIITIMNWEDYQANKIEGGQAEGQPEDRQRTGKGQPKDTNKNDKHYKNEKNNKQAFDLYVFYIQEINPKNKSKQRALSNIEKHLKNNSHEDLIQAVKNYKTVCIEKDPLYRKDPANFFGINEPYFRDFLPEIFKPQEGDDSELRKIYEQLKDSGELVP